jgi:hypothetical protein
MTTNTTRETERSSFREAIFEHKFIYDFLAHCWTEKSLNAEVLHSLVDDSGHDLLLMIDGIVNYIQVKVTAQNSKTTSFPIHRRLVEKQRAFILVLEYNRDDLWDCKYFLKRITKSDWEVGQNNPNGREHVKNISRVWLTGTKKEREKNQIKIEGIYKLLKQKRL